MYLVVDLLKKLMIAAVISLINYGIYYQLLIVLLLALFLILQFYFRPYSSSTLNIVDFIAELILLTSFVVSTYVYYIGNGGNDDVEVEIIEYVVLVMNGLVIVLYVICAIESRIILRSIYWIKSRFSRDPKKDDVLIF